jgi:hypothetical protein
MNALGVSLAVAVCAGAGYGGWWLADKQPWSPTASLQRPSSSGRAATRTATSFVSRENTISQVKTICADLLAIDRNQRDWAYQTDEAIKRLEELNLEEVRTALLKREFDQTDMICLGVAEEFRRYFPAS